MFNLFKKPKTDEYPEVVKEIHNEFFTAGDMILEEANALLCELEKRDLEKGKRLAAIGFNKTREAVAAVEAEQKIVMTKETANLVSYYKVNYPNNKFITEEQVKAICEKYGLVCGEISMYKGFVPESKLNLIEKFSLLEKDKPYLSVIDDAGEFIGQISKEECDISLRGYIDSGGKCIYLTSAGGARVGYSFDVPQYEKFRHLQFVKAVKEPVKMRICAPLKDMEIPSNKRVVGYKIQDIPDPVVLQPVKGGYLIVCAWGDEASDEIVVNETMN